MSAVAQLRRTFDDLADLPPIAVKQAALVVERFAAQTGRPITIRKRRYPLTAVTKLDRRGATIVTATVFGTPTGFWVWQTAGTGAHDIGPRRRHTKTGRPPAVAGTAWGHPVSDPVRHPGASGRGAWRRVDRMARQQVPGVILDAVRDVLKQVS